MNQPTTMVRAVRILLPLWRSEVGYVEAVKQLSHRGTEMLILAGNANEERHYGPPRVTEEELRGDFSADFDFVGLDTVRFDSTNPNGQGALAWSVLFRRSPPGGSRQEGIPIHC